MAGTIRESAMIERLWWRAGFGPRPRDLRGKRTHAELVHEFLHPRGAQLEGPEARVDGRTLDPLNVYGHDVLWWLDRMVRGRHPLAERMTLNWHDHWATSNSKVGDVKLMMRQQRTLRRYALGNFRTLARAMLRDGAMQIWLDLAGSTDDAPNENFAREFFELFTLGANNGYTEKDIRESARALTGFTFDYESKRFGFDPKLHDGGTKHILGQQGPLRSARRRRPRAREPPPRAVPDGAALGLLLAARRAAAAAAPARRRPTPVRLRDPAGARADPHRRRALRRPRGARHDQAAGRLRGRDAAPDRHARDDRRLGLDARRDGPAAVLPAQRERLGAERGVALDELAAHALPGRGLAPARCDQGRLGRPRSARPSRRSSARSHSPGEPWTSKATTSALASYSRRSVAGRDEKWEIKHYFPERERVLRHVLLAGPDAQVC